MSSGTHAAHGAVTRTAGGRVRSRELLRSPAAPWVVLAAMVIGTAGLLMYETRGTTLWLDEWTWVLHRRGDSLSTFLASHDGHLSVIPIAIYKLLFATAGLRHSWPYRALMIGGHVLTCVLLFAYARRRVTPLLALTAAALMLLFGAGWENLLWAFQITWNTSLAAGVAALLALDRRDRAGDIGACLLLLIALGSSAIGVPIVVGVAVETVLVRRGRPRDWWVVAVPIVLYVVWAVAYQHAVITRSAFLDAPGFVASGLASTLSGLAGLGGATGVDGQGTLMTWGPPLLVFAIAVAGWRLVRLGRLAPRVVSLAAIVLVFWALTAVGRYFFADPYSSRYLYVSAVFVVLLAVELARGSAPRAWAQVLIGTLAALAIVSNAGALRDHARILRNQALLTRADLAAVDIGRPVMPAGYVLHDIPGWPFVIVPARGYFAAARDLGTPAATPSQLESDPESARETADRELIAIHGVTLVAASAALPASAPPTVDLARSGTAAVRGGCVTFRPNPFAATGTGSAYVSLTVPPAGLALRALGGTVTVGLRRFGSAFQALGTLAPGAAAILRIAPDSSGVPWHVLLTPSGRALACGL